MPPTHPLLQLISDRRRFPDDGLARSNGCGLHPHRGASREPPGRQRSSYPGVAGRIQGGGAAPTICPAHTAGGSFQTARRAADGPRGDRGGAPARGRVGRTHSAHVLRPDQLRPVPEEGFEKRQPQQDAERQPCVRDIPLACEAPAAA